MTNDTDVPVAPVVQNCTREPVFDLSTPYQKRKALLALYGVMIILSTAFLGCWISYTLFGLNMALIGGLSCVVFVGGVLGYITVLMQQAVQEVNIKVVEEKQP